MLYEKNQITKLTKKMTALEIPYTKLLLEQVTELCVECHHTDKHLREVPTDVVWNPISAGDSWGGPFRSMWLRSRFAVPMEYANRKLVLCADVEAHECMIFLDSKPRGLFNMHGDELGANHSIGLISQSAVEGTSYEIALECYAGTPCLECHPYENYNKSKMPDANYMRTFRSVNVCAVRQDVSDFLFDLKTVNQLLGSIDENTSRHGEVLACVINVFQHVCQFPLDVEQGIWTFSMHAAHEFLKEILRVQNGPSVGSVGLIGHSHMDTAWLWTVAETKRKCARTYSNALSLMEWYPEYTFIQSSALHGAWMRDEYPSIFEDMKAQVANGRYEPNGAVWVECDCNITGGESMVRQFLWGQRFTMKEFGYKSDAFWLPDTFGYNPAIPQIMQGCGVKYFLTTKMEWNESNKFPYESFTWKGIDGTPVLVHLNRTHVWPDAASVIKNHKNLPDKHVSDAKLVSYGFGDGGGGPQYQMLEMSRRIEDLNGCPKAKHTTVSGFMQSLEKKQDFLPVWSGELYLELHRGTLTMMHDIKRSNRFAEMSLREFEALNAINATYHHGTDQKEKLNGWWNTILINQFHDILPGTCIPEVYDLSIPENYAVVEEVTVESKNMVGELTDDNHCITIFNSLNWTRNGQILLDTEYAIENAMNQRITNVMGDNLLCTIVQLPPMALSSFPLAKDIMENESPFFYDKDHIETPFASIRLDRNGAIASILDKSANRELRNFHGAPLNTFYLGEDVPLLWDNWDVDPDIDMKLKPQLNLISQKAVCDGPLQLRIESQYKIGNQSTLKQHMIFYRNTPQIDFETVLDWNEKHSFLKVGFDVDILSPTMKNEIQFGHIERPTHRNTSWDAAKSEVSNHKWSDLSEGRFGIAFLNDCKYGLSCLGSDVRISLHKGGCRPDPRGDQGIHQFTYSLLPHQGCFGAENVVRPAYELNTRPAYSIGKAFDNTSLCFVDASNIIVEAVKMAEEGTGYIIRLYECERSSAKSVRISFPKPPKEVYLTNMLEEKQRLMEISLDSIYVDFKAFEIKTLLVVN